MQPELFSSDVRDPGRSSNRHSNYGATQMKERGSLAILIAGYLGLLLTLFLGGFAVAISLVAQNRIQGVTDSALLYAHDRAVTKGIPNLEKLETAIDTFLNNAPSGQQLEVISLATEVNGVKSSLTLCAKHMDPIGRYLPGMICKSANAESFLVD